MKKLQADRKMSESDYDQLDRFLERFHHEQAMNLEMLDGFFTALHCAPDMISPSACLPEIWGGEEILDKESFESNEQLNVFLELVLRHWNDVLYRLKTEDVFLPILLDNESNGFFTGNDWAKGFMRGMDYHRDAWSDLMDDENEGGALVPILALYHEQDTDPDMRPYKEPVSEELREKLLVSLCAGVMRVYRYFAPHRQKSAQLAKNQTGMFRRRQAKVGRNDPCPCGSGKKYKKCCGEVTLH